MEQDESARKGLAHTPFTGEIRAPDTLLNGVLKRLEQRRPFLDAPTKGLSDELQQGLTHPQWEIRAAAVHTLGALETPGAQQAVLQALHDEHRLVRASAVRALGRLGRSEQLLPALHDEAWEVREMVVQVLAENSEIPTSALLQTATLDVNIHVREAAQNALQQSNNQQFTHSEVAQTARMTRLKQAFWRLLLLLKSQAPLLQKGTWFFAPIGLVILFIVCLLTQTASKTGVLIAILLAASAIGTAGIYNTDYDQGLELTLATPTSIRLLLFCRLLLVLGYNILLGSIASAALTLVYGGNFFQLVQLWLGPLVLLSSCSLLLSLLVGSLFASFSTLLFEAAQTIQFGIEQHFPTLYFTNFQYSLWQHSPATFLLIPCCLFLALLYVPNKAQMRSNGAGGREQE